MGTQEDGQTRIFNKNQALSLFNIYGCLTWYKKLERAIEAIRSYPWTNGQTDRLTDGQA